VVAARVAVGLSNFFRAAFMAGECECSGAKIKKNSGGRGVPDVAGDASPATGYNIPRRWTAGDSWRYERCGSSVGSLIASDQSTKGRQGWFS